MCHISVKQQFKKKTQQNKKEWQQERWLKQTPLDNRNQLKNNRNVHQETTYSLKIKAGGKKASIFQCV